MIDEQDIATVLENRLITVGLPVAWENKDFPSGTQHPFLLVEIVPVSTRDVTLKGGGEIHTGFVMAHVMTKPNTFATEARAIGKQIKGLFPYPLRLPVPGGEITITTPTQIMQGYPDGPHYRTPVKITYEAS